MSTFKSCNSAQRKPRIHCPSIGLRMTASLCPHWLSPPLRMNESTTKILPSSVLRISSATYLTVKSLYLSERIPQRYKFTLRRSAARSPRGGVLNKTKGGGLLVQAGCEAGDTRTVEIGYFFSGLFSCGAPKHQRSTVPRGLSVWADGPAHVLISPATAQPLLCE